VRTDARACAGALRIAAPLGSTACEGFQGLPFSNRHAGQVSAVRMALAVGAWHDRVSSINHAVSTLPLALSHVFNRCPAAAVWYHAGPTASPRAACTR
jgi:hypothetical protein